MKKYFAVIYNFETDIFFIRVHAVSKNPLDGLLYGEMYFGSFPSRKSAEEHIEMMESICSGNPEAVVPAAGGGVD
jgi:hypothetical protein